MADAAASERATLEDLARACHEAAVTLALGEPLQVAAHSLAQACERRLGYRVPPAPARVLRLVPREP